MTTSSAKTAQEKLHKSNLNSLVCGYSHHQHSQMSCPSSRSVSGSRQTAGCTLYPCVCQVSLRFPSRSFYQLETPPGTCWSFPWSHSQGLERARLTTSLDLFVNQPEYWRKRKKSQVSNMIWAFHCSMIITDRRKQHNHSNSYSTEDQIICMTQWTNRNIQLL